MPLLTPKIDAAVYELDAIFMLDFIKNNKIQSLPDKLIPPSGKFLRAAETASMFEGKWYGIPRWLCTNYLFFKKGDKIGNVKTLKKLEMVIKQGRKPGRGLLIDAKGRSTLGELYIDALLDNHGDLSKAEPFLTKDNLDPLSKTAIKRAVALCDKGFCRDRDYHYAEAFYPRQFARKRGRGLVGYSERLYYVHWEYLNSCKKGECLDPKKEVDVIEFPLSDQGSRPFAWVDILTISSKCTRQCLDDAVSFIEFVSDEKQVLRALIPPKEQEEPLPSRWRGPPRYLLPALDNLYSNKDLEKEASLYPKMREALDKAVPVTGHLLIAGQFLNKKLRDIGEKFDKEILK
jgi:thiamine pyridinylase